MPNENVRGQSGKRRKPFAGPVLSVLGCALLLWADAAVVHAAPARGPGTAQAVGGAPGEGCKECESRLNGAIKDLEARIDKDRKDAEDRIDKDVSLAEWILTVVIALTGVVFPVIGGLAAFFQIKQAREDAKAQLEDVKEQVERIRERFEGVVAEYQQNFPQFTAMDARIQRLLSEMKLRMPSLDDFNNANLFSDIPQIDRQYILDSEVTVAAISVFGLGQSPSLRARISSIYGIFARFYSLRDNTLKNTTEGDFVRAVAYATRVIDLNRESSEGYRMRGAIYLGRYLLLKDATPPDEGKLAELLRSAETDLDEAIAKCKKSTSEEVDAGAFYNRALTHYYREEYEKAVAVSKQLLGMESRVSRAQREQYLPSLYVNLGSFLAKRAILAAAAGRPDEAQKFSAEAVQAVTKGVRDFEPTVMEGTGLERLKKELEGELVDKQELSQLGATYVTELWTLVRSGSGRKA